MLKDENALQSFIYIHVDHLYRIMLHSVMDVVFIFTLLTVSLCVFLCTAIKITSIIDDTLV